MTQTETATAAVTKTNGATNGHTRPKYHMRFVGTLDFRHNDASQLDEIIKQIGGVMKRNECAFLISKQGKILRVIFGAIEHEMVDAGGRAVARPTRVVASRTYRIVSGGTFNPYMLQNYANDMDFELAHLKRLEKHLRDEGV